MESFQLLPTTLPSSSPSRTSSGIVVVSSPCIASSAPTPRKKKKRSKMTTTTIMIKVDDPGGTGVGSSVKVRPATRKPDPNAPKITRPCTECGKRFWSWKALFGHMRCHPERQWRGINPPPTFRSFAMRPPGAPETEPFRCVRAVMTEEDHEVAECLLTLADCPVITVNRGAAIVRCAGPMTCQKFECSSCKKVFGSHQALGGHRASHKNVKGCFAMTMAGDGRDEAFIGSQERCHWEKGGDDEEEEEEEGELFCLDLNRPAPTADEDSTLDLRLCL